MYWTKLGFSLWFTVVGKCQQAPETYSEREHRCALVLLLLLRRTCSGGKESVFKILSESSAEEWLFVSEYFQGCN